MSLDYTACVHIEFVVGFEKFLIDDDFCSAKLVLDLFWFYHSWK